MCYVEYVLIIHKDTKIRFFQFFVYVTLYWAYSTNCISLFLLNKKSFRKSFYYSQKRFFSSYSFNIAVAMRTCNRFSENPQLFCLIYTKYVESMKTKDFQIFFPTKTQNKYT